MKRLHNAALIAAVGAGALAIGVSNAATLGGDLTPVGAEKAGNSDGSIPAWNGGITAPPAGYVKGKHHVDPYANDKPVLQISPANYKQHAAKLPDGAEAMFARYQDYRMDIYPTRRSAAFPQRIYDMTRKNSTSCKLSADGDGLEGCAEGFPFPMPKNGAEVMWNHKVKYKGLAVSRFNGQAPVSAGGSYNLIGLREQFLNIYNRPGATSESINNILLYYKQEVTSPPRLAGQVLLVHETLDAKATPRQAWLYNPGQRRVRRAPDVAYDNPGTASDGLRTNDMTDMFNGALDRYTWTLVGKKEMYVPYNSYRIKAGTKASDLVRPGHLNPDRLRYELHRVWVVEAKLKPGMRHINPRRTFYFDEDSWQILAADHYDSAGKLWRYSEGYAINFYEVPLLWTTLEVHNDLKSGRYLVQLLDNGQRPHDFRAPTSPAQYAPQALRTEGVR